MRARFYLIHRLHRRLNHLRYVSRRSQNWVWLLQYNIKASGHLQHRGFFKILADILKGFARRRIVVGRLNNLYLFLSFYVNIRWSLNRPILRLRLFLLFLSLGLWLVGGMNLNCMCAWRHIQVALTQSARLVLQPFDCLALGLDVFDVLAPVIHNRNESVLVDLLSISVDLWGQLLNLIHSYLVMNRVHPFVDEVSPHEPWNQDLVLVVQLPVLPDQLMAFQPFPPLLNQCGLLMLQFLLLNDGEVPSEQSLHPTGSDVLPMRLDPPCQELLRHFNR